MYTKIGLTYKDSQPQSINGRKIGKKAARIAILKAFKKQKNWVLETQLINRKIHEEIRLRAANELRQNAIPLFIEHFA